MAQRDVLLVFVVLSRCLQLTASKDCFITVTPSPQTSDPSFCVGEATARRAKSLTVFNNGTCRMVVDCADSASVPCCPIFVRKRPTPPQLLLRTRVERDTNPYDLFKSTSTNGSTIDASTKLTMSDPFKSRLISVTPTPFSQIRVQMLTGNVGSELKLKAELRFRIEEQDSIPDGSWFSKSHLVGSLPWDIDQMQQLNYTFFSIDGSFQRRFYQSHNNNGCDVTAGFMLTTVDNGNKCTWEKYPIPGRSSEFGRYMWAVQDGRYGVWRIQSYDADEFRLIGEDDRADRVHYIVV